MLDKGDIEPTEKFPPSLMLKIWNGAQRCRHLPIGIKRILIEQDLVEDW